jgi:hypothetical protein
MIDEIADIDEIDDISVADSTNSIKRLWAASRPV